MVEFNMSGVDFIAKNGLLSVRRLLRQLNEVASQMTVAVEDIKIVLVPQGDDVCYLFRYSEEIFLPQEKPIVVAITQVFSGVSEEEENRE